MKFLFTWSSSHPRKALALAVVFSLSLGSGAAFLRVDASMEHLLSTEDARVQYLNEVRENFGEKPLILAVVRTPDLFAPETLLILKSCADELSKIPGVADSSSLFNALLPKSRGRALVAEPALPPLPASREVLKDRQKTLLENSLVRGNLLSETGNALAILLFLEPEKGPNHEKILEQMKAVQFRILAQLPASTEFDLLGVPLVKTEAQKHIHWDLEKLAPVSLLVIGLFIFLFYRSLTAVLLPLLTGVLSVIATLGFMGFAGYQISIFLSTIVVLILVLGCTEDLHILAEYLLGSEEGKDKLTAIQSIGATAGTALVLTSATTVLSFVTIAFTEIVGLRDFAVSCAFGMAVNFLITILVVPAMLSILPPPRVANLHGKRGFLARMEKLIVGLFLNHRKAVLIVLGAVLLVTGLGISKLETNTNYLRFFSPDSPVVAAYRRFSKDFGGASYVTVTVETNQRNGISRPENLKKLALLHDFLTRDSGKHWATSTS